MTLTLASCAVFDPAKPQELAVRYDGLTVTLTSDKPVLRGSVGIVAASVVSEYCDPCTPDSEGVVLLRLLEVEGQDYGTVLELGEVVGLERIRVVAVRRDEARAVVRTFGAVDVDKPPGGTP